MTRTCCCCRHYEPGEIDPEMGRLGKCALARRKYGGDVTKPWSYPACKGFEEKEERRKRR